MSGAIMRQMWKSEKKTVAFSAELWKQRDEARAVLRDARDKLRLYRTATSGEYVGGVEFTELMRRIHEVLR